MLATIGTKNRSPSALQTRPVSRTMYTYTAANCMWLYNFFVEIAYLFPPSLLSFLFSRATGEIILHPYSCKLPRATIKRLLIPDNTQLAKYPRAQG